MEGLRKMNKPIEDFIGVLRKKLPTEKEKMDMILTLLGCSGHLAEFISRNYNIEKLPIEIKYSCALICGNMIALTCDGECKILDSSDDYNMGEQTQERFYRLFKKIVTLLYESLKEE